MKKNIKLPAPQLSQLKEVNIDLDMNGEHYELLATSDERIPEEVALTIVNDLMDEDGNKLTINELRYLFMLVKINSLENKYTARIKCTHRRKSGEYCNHENTYDIFLSDSDLNPTKKSYVIPTIMFKTDENTEKKYTIMPPTMDMEVALINWFLMIKNKSLKDLTDDKQTSFDFGFIRNIMHLVDESGNRLIQDLTDFEIALSYKKSNKFSTISELNKIVVDESQYGVQNKIYEFKCKECGGTLVFQLPLLHGLTV